MKNLMRKTEIDSMIGMHIHANIGLPGIASNWKDVTLEVTSQKVRTLCAVRPTECSFFNKSASYTLNISGPHRENGKCQCRFGSWCNFLSVVATKLSFLSLRLWSLWLRLYALSCILVRQDCLNQVLQT